MKRFSTSLFEQECIDAYRANLEGKLDNVRVCMCTGDGVYAMMWGYFRYLVIIKATVNVDVVTGNSNKR